MMTWEERMAERTHIRHEAQKEIEDREDQESWKQTKEEWITAYAETLTVEQASSELAGMLKSNIGCACIGGSRCCQIRLKALERVLGL